jgi:hypothetical protein
MTKKGRVFMIDPPPADGVDRELLCQIALETMFERVCATEPDRHWTGEEGDFWQIRVGATMAGWTRAEIDDALMDLAANRHLGRLANRITDEQIVEIAHRLDDPASPLPDPPSSRPWVFLGGAIVAAGFGLAMMLGWI